MNLEDNIKVAQLLGHVSSLRDHETSAHNLRVAWLSALLGEKMGLDNNTMQGLMKGAFLHDIGKIGIPDKVLLKAGKLDDAEWLIMRQHPVIGAQLVQPIQWFEDAIAVIRHHHERYDGSGYPDQLRADQIPLTARIFSIIDVFDALISARPYKTAFSLPDSLNIIEKGSGMHFDPQVVIYFLPLAREFYQQIKSQTEAQLKQNLVVRRNQVFGA